MEFPNYVLYLITWVGLIAGVSSLFGEAEETVKKKHKKEIGYWLTNLNSQHTSYLSTTFLEIFYSFFTKRRFSLFFIKKSIYFSITSVLLLIVFWGASNSEQLFKYFYENHLLAIFGILVAASLNFIPDYISIIQTKLFLETLSKKNSPLLLLGFVVLDIVVTFIIGIIPYILLWKNDMGSTSFNDFLVNLLTMNQNYGFGSFPTNERADPPLGIYFYATFFTSIWFWLYTISVIMASALKKVILPLDIKKKPIRSIGIVSNLIISLLFLVLLIAS